MRIGLHWLLMGVTLLLVAGCGRFPYQMPLQQGNVVTEEGLNKLAVGMSKRDVELAMGTPLLRDTFNQDRWDYTYSLNQNGRGTERKHLSVFFEQDKLTRLVGDYALRGSDEKLPPRADKVVTVPPLKRRSGIFGPLTPDFMRSSKRERQVPENESTAKPNALEEN